MEHLAYITKVIHFCKIVTYQRVISLVKADVRQNGSRLIYGGQSVGVKGICMKA